MATPSFKDHFSAHASSYARYRPRYPEALFAYLASLCPAHDLAWDCATGNGQAAHGLAAYFDHVVATDASADQIANAAPHAHVAYHVAPAARSPLAAHTADLVTVAQALHWFDFDAFYAEVHRVLKPGAVVAAWTYGLLQINPTLDALIQRYYSDVVGRYWPPERRLVEDGYRSLPFPFDEIRPPRFTMSLLWTLDDLLGYLGTWSATRRFIDANTTNPVEHIAADLAGAWGDPADTKLIQWTLPVILFIICGIIVGFISDGVTIIEAGIGSVLGQLLAVVLIVYVFKTGSTSWLAFAIGAVPGARNSRISPWRTRSASVTRSCWRRCSSQEVT